jgi:hypothetical protein
MALFRRNIVQSIAFQWKVVQVCRMIHRRAILLCVGIIIAAAVFAWIVRHPQTLELMYQGKSLTEWVLLLDANTAHQSENDAAQRAFLNMGQQAVPGLVRILQRRPAVPPHFNPRSANRDHKYADGSRPQGANRGSERH